MAAFSLWSVEVTWPICAGTADMQLQLLQYTVVIEVRRQGTKYIPATRLLL